MGSQTILFLLLASLTASISGSNQFSVNSFRGNGFSVDASNNISGFHVNTDNGFRLYITIEKNGFVVNGVNEMGVALNADVKLVKGQIKLTTGGN